jgi:hypothetical protein
MTKPSNATKKKIEEVKLKDMLTERLIALVDRFEASNSVAITYNLENLSVTKKAR